VTDTGTRSETFYLTKLSQFEALGNAVRVRLLHLASTPITVAELADRLDMPKTRLYYHVNLLVDEGLLLPVDQRRSGARTETLYQRAGKWLQPSPTFLEDVQDIRRTAEVIAGAIVNPSRAELESVLDRRLSEGTSEGTFVRMVATLTSSQIERFSAEITRLADELADEDGASEPSPTTYAFTCVFVPVDPPDRSEET